MIKNLNLGNFLTILRLNISKLQIFLKNMFHSNWRSNLVLSSGQKPKKSLELFFKKSIKVPDFGLIWRPFRKYLQIMNFFQKSSSVTFLPLQSPNFMQKIRKILTAVSENCVTSQPIITNHQFYRWRYTKDINITINMYYIKFTKTKHKKLSTTTRTRIKTNHGNASDTKAKTN